MLAKIPDLKKENPFSTIKHGGRGMMFRGALEAFQLNTRKMKICLQEALNLLQNLLSEINDLLTDDFADAEVPAN
ncbi:hypothetical protein TNCV_4128341 [Trichonephila clavipes]|nr:hypothetical protein TNCV_4128341 [Trichonephila clavipes]